jgi:hypothetical protein
VKLILRGDKQACQFYCGVDDCLAERLEVRRNRLINFFVPIQATRLLRNYRQAVTSTTPSPNPVSAPRRTALGIGGQETQLVAAAAVRGSLSATVNSEQIRF